MADHDPNSADHSSNEYSEGEEDASQQISGAQWSTQEHTSPGGTTTSQQARPMPPMQKRRRVTRACDECRRKKIKCDGKQPCTHCTVYSYDCTYDQPSNRRRNPAPQYIEALESRLKQAEALLQTFIPNFNIKDADLEALVAQRKAKVAQQSARSEPQAPPVVASSDEARRVAVQDAQLHSMIESTGQLDLDEGGEWDFHGGSSGAVFLKRMRDQFGGLLGPEQRTPFLPRAPRFMTSKFDSPRSSESPYETGLPNLMDLPPRETARTMCSFALRRACALLRFVHAPTFYEMFDRIYDTPPEDFTDLEHRYLPLIYVTIALGGLFNETKPGCQEANEAGYKASIEQGVKYFKIGRNMMDITECRDIVSLQTIVFMILFLQATSNLSTCYSYIGVALRCAVRMGMHRNVSGNFDLIEREVRRRVFWVLRKMDTYVAALLGFPRMLSDDDVDQEYPIEVDDEYITKDAIIPMPQGKIALYAATNAHTRLMTILGKVIKYIYPIKGVEQLTHPNAKPSYVISHAKIKEIETDLQAWYDQLPMALRPGNDISEDFVRVQQLLRMAYAHVQMMLYRPFLHYVSARYSSGKSLDERAYACAAACVSVSRNIVHITTEMKRRGVLLGAYWFTMYTTFFAILSLAFFVLENPDKDGAIEILEEANAGKNALRDFARTSMGADRCNTALNILFEKLPEKLQRTRSVHVAAKKKRSAASLSQATTHPTSSGTDTSTTRPATTTPLVTQRAATFPVQMAAAPTQRHSVSFDNFNYTHSPGPSQHVRRSFHELTTPNNMSGAGTPDSAGSGSSMQASYSMQQPYAENFIPELGAMMFPSADPFAYPNQPMIGFENRHVKPTFARNMIDTNMYLSNTATSVSSPYDNIEGQLFGPLPPYLMQNEPHMDLTQMNIDMTGVKAEDMRPHTGLTPGIGGGVNFDEIFADGNADWNNLMGDQVYMQ